MSNQFLNRGDYLFKQGDHVDTVYLIKSGQLVLCDQTTKMAKPLKECGPQTILGEEFLFLPSVWPYSACVVEAAEIVLIKKNDILENLEKEEEWIRNVVKTLCDRYQHSYQDLKEHGIPMFEELPIKLP